MKNEKTFIKFIIPCWGVATTIGRMLDSILTQTFQDFQIVCVEDCSRDKTWLVLKEYQKKHPEKISIMRTLTNSGAGVARNIGYTHTKEILPSEYIWVVDGDDYLADKDVLKDLHEFTVQNPNYDIINIGITWCGKYSVGKLGWPIASWGRIIRSNVYVTSPSRNIPYGNDVYAHFVMFDNVEDSRIGSLDRKCYICPQMGKHHNNTEKNMNVMKTVGDYLMQHEFVKKDVANAIRTSSSGVWKRLVSANPKFHPVMKRKVSILMASFPHRKKWMLQCIERLIPQCDNFYLWLNEYKEIPEELKKFDPNKLHVTLGEKDLKENGRYLFLEKPELQDDYCFICDDDINWPKDYVKKTIECFKRNGDNILIAYFINGGLNTYHRQDEVKTGYEVLGGIPHYRFGAGTCAFIPSQMKFKFTHEELEAHYDMELFFAHYCVDKKLKLYSPSRPANWINFIQDGKNQRDIGKHALSRCGIASRVRTTYNYMKKHGMISKDLLEKQEKELHKFQFG